MVDVILVMLVLAGLTLVNGDADTAAEPSSLAAVPAEAEIASERERVTPCTASSPVFRDLGRYDRVATPQASPPGNLKTQDDRGDVSGR